MLERVDWSDFKRWLLTTHKHEWAGRLYCAARKYCFVLWVPGEVPTLYSLSDSNLSKFLGVYKSWRNAIEAKIVLKPDERFPNTEFGTVVVELNGLDIATLEVKNPHSEVESSFDPNMLKEGENLLVVKGITFKRALYFSVEVYAVPKE